MTRLNLIAKTSLLAILTGGLFLSACAPWPQKAVLNTSEMTEADDNIVDSLMGPSVLSIYLNKTLQSIKGDTVSYADVYVCKSFKRDSVLGDTVIILDTQLRTRISGEPYIYWTGLRKGKRLKACKIAVPENQLDKLKKYPYKYAQVTLITYD